METNIKHPSIDESRSALIELLKAISKKQATISQKNKVELLLKIIKTQKFQLLVGKDISTKLQSYSVRKLMSMTKKVPELLELYYPEIGDRHLNKKSPIEKEEEELRFKEKTEAKIKCFRCGGVNTRKCGKFTYNTQKNNTVVTAFFPTDFSPEFYKQRYECNNCEYPENYFYYIKDKNNSKIGYYLHPISRYPLLYNEIHLFHEFVKHFENFPDDYDKDNENIKFITPIIIEKKNKNTKLRKNYLPKFIELLSKEIEECEIMLNNKKKQHQKAVHELNILNTNSNATEPITNLNDD